VAVQLFLSCVSNEFGIYREPLRRALTLPDVAVNIQEDFKPQGGDTLSMLMAYIAPCAAVVHFVGEMPGAAPPNFCVEALLRRSRHPGQAAAPRRRNRSGKADSYTQWEAWLAVYLEKAMLIVAPTTGASRGPEFATTPESQAAQAGHHARLKAIGRYPDEPFANADVLATQVLRSSVIPALKKAAFKTDSPAPPLFDISRIDRYAPKELIGREAKTKLIEDAWAKAVAGESQRPRVMAFVALGGEGKTALVAKWAVGVAEKGWPGAEAAFAWSFYSQGSSEQQQTSSDPFLAAGLKFFGAPAIEGENPSDKGRRLAEWIGKKQAALILDGLEPLQYPPTSPLAGQLKDQGLSALLKGLAQNSRGLCLITTRYKIRDIEAYAAAAPQGELEPLSKEAGARLLETLGVNGARKEREDLSARVRGHALTLNLIGSYLKKFLLGDIRKRDRFALEKANRKFRAGYAFHVMDTYVQEFESKEAHGGSSALALLRSLGLFDRSADMKCLAALWGLPAINGLTESLADLSEEDRNEVFTELADAKLLTMNLDTSGELASLDAHPLLREYFANALRENRPQGLESGPQAALSASHHNHDGQAGTDARRPPAALPGGRARLPRRNAARGVRQSLL
jgi:hypothetical protein